MKINKLFTKVVLFISIIVISGSNFSIARAYYMSYSFPDKIIYPEYIIRNISGILFFLGIIFFYKFYKIKKLLYLGYLYLIANICLLLGLLIINKTMELTIIIVLICSLFMFFNINKYIYSIDDRIFLSVFSKIIFFNEHFKYRLAWIYYNEENYKKSLKILQRCTSINSYFLLANNYEQINEYEKAIEMYTKLLEKETNDRQDIYYNRGAIYRKLGKDNEAIDDFNRSINCKKPDPKAYIALGVIMDELGEYEEAKLLFYKGNLLDDSYSKYIPEKYK